MTQQPLSYLREYIFSVYRRVSLTIDNIVRGESDFDKAKIILPFFYYFLFFIAFTKLEGLNYIIQNGNSGFDPRWPLFWAQSLDYGSLVTIIFLLTTLTSLYAAFFPYKRLPRIFAFIGLFLYHSYLSSFGGPMHQLDHLLWVGFIFMFLPNLTEEPPSGDKRRIFSLIFWGTQAFMLLTYSMAGLGKITYGFIQLLEGQANVFSPDAAALHVSTLLLSMKESVPLGSVIIEYPLLAWFPFLIILYIQFFSILVAFRPSIHRLWGVSSHNLPYRNISYNARDFHRPEHTDSDFIPEFPIRHKVTFLARYSSVSSACRYDFKNLVQAKKFI